jgi:hypothetical protein
MGCDIHSICEVFNPQTEKWERTGDIFPVGEFDYCRELFKKEFGHEPFSQRNYGLFGFLANVRNMSECTPLAYSRGLPPEYVNYWESNDSPYLGDHSFSWLLLSELLDFDYSKKFYDQRFREHRTYADLVGEEFFQSVEIMKTLGPPEYVRVVFGFDS